MSASMNMILLIGRLGRDPDIGGYADGSRYALLSLATSDKWKDKATGEPRERTEWHRVVIHAQSSVNYAERWFQKGTQIQVIGKIEARSWEDNGTRKHITEVVVRPYRGNISLLRDGRQREGGHDGTSPDPNAPLFLPSYHAVSGGR